MENNNESSETPDASELVASPVEGCETSDTNQTKPQNPKLPKHKYTREQLLSWKDVRCSRLKPACMSREYESSEGIWDPEKWFNSTIGESTGLVTSNNYNQFNLGEKMYSRGRKPDWEVDEGGRRGAGKILNDRGSSLKPNVGDSDVVLMPQRNFNSGCYINSNSDAQSKRDGRDQRFSQRVIGSGRIPVVDRLKGRADDNMDSWNDRMSNISRPRGKISDRRFEPNLLRSDYKSSRDVRRAQMPEPSWFRDGPVSQADTIELHGFNVGDQADMDIIRDRNKKSSQPQAIVDRLFGNKLKNKKDDNTGEEGKKELDEEKEPSSNVSTEKDLKVTNENNEGIAKQRDVNDIHSAQQNKPCDVEQSSGDFDFDAFFKIVNIPDLPDSEIDSTASRFQAFFSSRPNQEPLTNGVTVDMKPSGHSFLPPPPPVYGHSIENLVDPEEEKKNFMSMLQKAHLVQSNFQSPVGCLSISGSTDVDSLMPCNKNTHASVSMKVASDLKAMLKVNAGDFPDTKSNNCLHTPVYGPVANGNKVNANLNQPLGLNRTHVMTHMPLPVGSKVTRVTDLESDAFKSNQVAVSSSVGIHFQKQNDKEEDLTAFNKLLGMISQSLPNQNQNQPGIFSAPFNQPTNHILSSLSHQPINSNSSQPLSSSNGNLFLASMSGDKGHSPAARPSPIVFGTCPPTNLATPMPIHASHLVNQFISNQGTKVAFNSFDAAYKFNNQSGFDQMSKESVMTSQGSEKMHPTFMPTSVIRQMVHDKEKKRGLKMDGDTYLSAQTEMHNNQDAYPSGSKVSPQNALWTLIRSNAGENRGSNGSFFPSRTFNPQHSHSYSQHNHFPPQVPSVPLYPRPQQPSSMNEFTSLIQCLQQGRMMPQQQQPIPHPLFQQQINPPQPKRAIVKGATHSNMSSLAINPEQHNINFGNHVALQGGQVLNCGQGQVDQSTQAAMLAVIHQALSANQKHNQPNQPADNGSGLDVWMGGTSVVNGSSVNRLPNQVKLQ